eukprot:1758007-Rhodomonas_salina.2
MQWAKTPWARKPRSASMSSSAAGGRSRFASASLLVTALSTMHCSKLLRRSASFDSSSAIHFNSYGGRATNCDAIASSICGIASSNCLPPFRRMRGYTDCLVPSSTRVAAFARMRFAVSSLHCANTLKMAWAAFHLDDPDCRG